MVQRILVRDGDRVRAGQALVELDPTAASADSRSIDEQCQAAQSEALRSAALLAALAPAREAGDFAGQPVIEEGTGSQGPVPDMAMPREQLRIEWADIRARLAKASAEITRRQAESHTAHELVAKLQATVPIAQRREADFDRLAAQGFVSGHALQDRQRERLELERDLATQRARAAEALAALHETQSTRVAYLAETRRTLRERGDAARLRREQALQEQAKARQRQRLATLRAPVDGIVQQLAAHTEGGVVTEAQVIMVIVPMDAAVLAEVILDNKDIGFVRAGQRAAIKLETFLFTRYGTLDATVTQISADSVPDEKRGAIFPLLLRLDSTTIDIDGRAVSLSPGMNVSAEIKTGRRRVIDYLLSPLQRAADESLRER